MPNKKASDQRSKQIQNLSALSLRGKDSVVKYCLVCINGFVIADSLRTIAGGVDAEETRGDLKKR